MPSEVFQHIFFAIECMPKLRHIAPSSRQGKSRADTRGVMGMAALTPTACDLVLAVPLLHTPADLRPAPLWANPL